MQKEEFEKLIGKTVSAKDYSVIEFVYNYYPTIDEVNGKQEIADLYTKYGMRLINDMVSTADRAKVLEESILRTRANLEALTKEYKELKEGPWI